MVDRGGERKNGGGKKRSQGELKIQFYIVFSDKDPVVSTDCSDGPRALLERCL